MTFARRLLRVAALGLAVAAVGAPASYPQDPYSGEGYGGSMDSGSSVNAAEAHALDPEIQGVFVPQDPYSGEGYGGSMDSGSPVNAAEVNALDPAIQGVFAADFWNYSISGEKISNYSPGVAAEELARLSHALPSSPA
jgi:hypothetical protein